jgi:3-hydroxyacyl-CoA dehydrogenase
MKLVVNKAAVLGAGVMGAQIAAHLANANVPVVLFDLPAKEGDKNGIVKKALDGLKRLQPSPLVTRDKLQYIDAANYEEHLELLSGCDLIIEAIAERMDWKNDLYKKLPRFWRRPQPLPPTPPGCRSMRLAEGLARGAAPEFLRHPLLQPAALHAAGRNHRHPRHRSGHA